MLVAKFLMMVYNNPIRHLKVIFSYDKNNGSGFVDESESTRFYQDYYNGPFQVNI